MSRKYILAIPNFSDGRRKEIYETVANTIRNRDGIKLLNCEPENDFNRTVLTIIGEPTPLKKALIDMAGKIYELVDMSDQQGSHPRIGSLDVIPLFPFHNISLDEVKDIADELGQELFEKYQVPVYFSGDNARTKDKKSIAFIRKGGYEGLRNLLENEDGEGVDLRRPDLSVDGRLSEKNGATIIFSDKEGSIAYNVFLSTKDVSIAQEIAKSIRASSGGFVNIMAVGIYFPEKESAVVSMNIANCTETPLYRAYEFIKIEAEKYGVSVSGSEIVGPIKAEYLINNLRHYLGLQGLEKDQILESHLMGLE